MPSREKETASPGAALSAAAPGTPFPHGAFRLTYSAGELWADGVVHALGIVAAPVAAAILLVSVVGSVPGGHLAAASVYLGTLLFSLAASAAYNVWPVTPTKWILRRFDHSAIYALIAGTYTPFLVAMDSFRMLVLVWVAAAGGIALKLAAPGRFDRLAIALYLALGWSSVAIFHAVVESLPEKVVWLVVAGGVLYSAGIVFHVLDRRFHNAIWHGFVLLAAGVHFGAVALLLRAAAA
jgi:hemolysin III